MDLQVFTQPSEEPVSLAEAKNQARIDASGEDALVALYISAARQKCEEIARRALVTQTLKLSLDAWPAQENFFLPRPPLIGVTSIVYTDVDGVSRTFSDYVVNTIKEPGCITLKRGYAWPSVTLRESGGIVVTYQAGYGSATAVPHKYKAAILLLVAHLYEHREAAMETVLQEIPMGVMALAGGDRGWY
jgi:uncharacterized phiE125 gp8 family phage protein